MFGHKDWKGLSELASYNNTDSESRERARSQIYKWIEYWKLHFKSKTFTPLTDPDGKWTLVLMTRADFGLIGSWNKYLKTPFETFYFGGAGVGARVYLSILGYLGIDWAYGFDKVWGHRGGSQVHFVLGQEF